MSGAVACVETLPVLSAAALEQTPPQQRWLIETLWGAEDVGVIGGCPKSCKTWLGLEMAVSVASGTLCLQRFQVRRRGSALIYLAEDAAASIRERLVALCHYRKLSLEQLDVQVISVPSLRLDSELDLARLDATIAKYRPVMLLLDPLVRLHRADENNAQEISALLASLRELQRRHGIALLLTHHSRKNARSAQLGQSLRGSSDLHAWVDSALYLSHHKGHLQLVIEHRHAAAPEPLALRLCGEPPHLELLAESNDGPQSLDERVLEHLAQCPRPISRTQLRANLGVNNQRLGDVLQSLQSLGRIQRVAEGWRL